MKIKRYSAASMRAALALVRAEQGPDAVILSSRRGEDGIEVIAAVDYDEALFAEANRQRALAVSPEAPTPTTLDQSPVQVQTPARAQTPAAAAQPPVPTPSPKLIPASFRKLTLSSLPSIAPELFAETGLAGMTWNDRRMCEPLKARVLEELTAMDIAPDVAMALAAHTPQRTSLDDRSLIPLALLVKHLPVVNDLGGGVSGGITAVVGPTGAGKTTTIAKLAARWCMQHGSQDLALVSTDGYRIGARDQLTTYARVLGALLVLARMFAMI